MIIVTEEVDKKGKNIFEKQMTWKTVWNFVKF